MTLSNAHVTPEKLVWTTCRLARDEKVAGSIALPIVCNNSPPASWRKNSRHTEIHLEIPKKMLYGNSR